MNKRNNEKGITLIALVITIVVLLIMAGFSVSVMVGDNSVIDQAKNSKEEMEIAQWEEKINQAIIEAEGGNRDVILDDIIGELIDKGVIEDPDDVDRYTGAVTTKEPEHIIEGLLDDYVDAPGGKCGGCGAGSGYYGGYNWSCSTCGASGGYYWCSKCGYNTGSKESHRTISCSTCGGDGRVSYTSTYNCSHGYYSSHYYCQHSNNRSSATHYYCAHSQAGVQHD